MVAKGGNLWKHPRLLASMVEILLENKPGTARVGAISKAQNCKRGPFGLCETLVGCKSSKKIEGRTLWRH